MKDAVLHRLSMLGLWGLCQVAAVIASIWMLAAALTGSRRAWTHCEKSIEPDEGKPVTPPLPGERQ